MRPKFGDGKLERNARPRRRLLEDHPDRAAGKDVRWTTVGFHLHCPVEQRVQFVCRQRFDGKEIALHIELSPSRSATRSRSAAGSSGFAKTFSTPSTSSKDS